MNKIHITEIANCFHCPSRHKREEEVRTALHNTSFNANCRGCARKSNCWAHQFCDAVLFESVKGSGVYYCANNSKLHDKREEKTE